ncbi:hypothetical protein [Archangium violaceum]|uniref:Uncharacterized protein n=1 Tax=Archangium violaceum Cb vi76 TaxID=1406225 RepID=A0A084SYC6_9BACT|nr:hypothetical protein [Archangium violaceum]KFA93461.1 hypothetical protein Q664_08960 [Archangium violaceum Cb vi76]
MKVTVGRGHAVARQARELLELAAVEVQRGRIEVAQGEGARAAQGGVLAQRVLGAAGEGQHAQGPPQRLGMAVQVAEQPGDACPVCLPRPTVDGVVRQDPGQGGHAPVLAVEDHLHRDVVTRVAQGLVHGAPHEGALQEVGLHGRAVVLQRPLALLVREVDVQLGEPGEVAVQPGADFRDALLQQRGLLLLHGLALLWVPRKARQALG